MTVGEDSLGNVLGYSSIPPTFGSLTPPRFSVSGTQYAINALAYSKPSNLLSITFNEGFTLFDFTLTADGVTVSSNEETIDSIHDEKKYTWEIPDPGWSIGQSVNVRLMMDICDRSQGVVEAILATTPSYDFCDGVNPSELADITELDVTGFSVGRLQNSDFDDLPNLHVLDLSGSHLVEDGRQNLPADAFQGLSELRTLDLSDNPILELPMGIFDGLSNLRSLIMNDTQIRSLPKGLFDGLTSLTLLNVRNGGYLGGGVNPHFHPDLFQDQANLELLDVRPSTPFLAAPLSFKPLTSLSRYNTQAYTRPADGPANLDYSSKANYGRWGGHTVTLTWDAPTGVTGITGYRVLRTSEDAGPLRKTSRGKYDVDFSRFAYEIARTGASTTFYVDGRNRDLVFSDGDVDSDGGLAPWFRYYVVAVTADGDTFPASVKADDKDRARLGTNQPPTPTLRSHRCDHLGNRERNGDYVYLEWDAPNDPTVTGFRIEYDPGANASWQTLIADTGNLLDLDYNTLQYFGPPGRKKTQEEQFIFDAFRRLDGSVDNHDDSREFRIRAINAWGNGGLSNEVDPF